MEQTANIKASVDNMSFTLRAMAALKTSRFISFGEDSFALATGTDSASENWAFFPPFFTSSSASDVIDVKKVESVCGFFDKLGLPFVWPLFPGAGQGRKLLEEAGLSGRGELLVMVSPELFPEKNHIKDTLIKRDSQGPKALERGLGRSLKALNQCFLKNHTCGSLTFEVNKRAYVWAETAWMAFDSPPVAPASFADLARGLMDSENFFLILAKRDGLPVGTAMLTLGSGRSKLTKNAGIYYFATISAERKKGVGEAMLREAARLAFQRGHSVLTLQATPSGAPFYASRGFKPLFRLPLYSFSEEVF